MKQKKNIRGTLKQALFTSPNPPKGKNDFLYLHDFIFPNKELFISFLEEENTERQITLAKDILLCITYDSHFSPPTRLLFNILDMDSGDLHEKVDNYIKRDHFVHLVHSYILGVYLYFYHTPINEKVTKLFQLKRSKKKILDSSMNISAKKDVIIAWRYFVLYHDLAYPFEYYLGIENNTDSFKDKQKKYIKAFEKISKSLGKDLVFKSLSKIIAINNLNTAHNEESFGLLVSNYLIEEIQEEASTEITEKAVVKEIDGKNKDIIDDLSPTKWGNAKKLAGIYGYKTLRNIVNIFPKENICAVLFDSNNYPLVLYIPTNTVSSKKEEEILDTEKDSANEKGKQDKSHVVYLTKYYKKRNNNPMLLASFPFEDLHYNKNYTIQYFYANPFEQISVFFDYLFSDIEKRDYQEALEHLANLTKSKLELITTENEFQQYCFEIYLVLYKLAGYYKYMEDDPSINSSAIDGLLQEIQNLNNNIPDLISSVLNKLLKNKLPQKEYFQFTEKDADETVREIFSDAFGDYETMIANISTHISGDIIANNNLVVAIRSIRENLGTKLKFEIDPTFLIKYETNSIDTEAFFSSVEKDPFFLAINKKMKEVELGDFEHILNNYRPIHGKRNGKYYDHGIYSALVMIEILNIYEIILSHNQSDINLLRLKNLAINTDISQWDQKKNYKRFDILTESCFAIAIHNLYPSELENKYYKTDLLKSPFAYFAILTDTLQPWDRKFSANQAYMDLPYATTSNNFNIEIIRNKIRITEGIHEIKLEKRLNQLKNSLNDFLKNASDNIDVILSEIN
ncbi:hypothetical protein [Dysgonomonas termitidis]|uniref:TerB N-terminal domain-containing protein n=1 Tax=Dysgonomonas termitidis TaxID=1516126 RepID=A0ABV9KYE6_9BACT